MSQENVDLVYRYGEALNARKIPDGLLAPGFVMVNAETAVTDGTFHGAAGVIQWTRIDGKISHIRIFLHRQEGLKAVGLEE